jgi:hypothetical protein
MKHTLAVPISCRLSREFRSGSMEEIETFLAVIEAGSQTVAARRHAA